MGNIIYKYSEAIKGEEMKEAKTTQYKAIKLFSVKDIIIHESYTCDDAVNKAIRKFGYSDFHQWNKETEDWIKRNIPEGIPWLLKNGFIEEREAFKYNENMVYIMKADSSLYKLHRSDSDLYSFCSLMNSDCHSHGFNDIDKSLIMARHYGKVYECDSVEAYFNGNFKEV